MKNYNIGADIIRIVSGFGVVLIHVTDPYLIYPPFFGVGGLEWLILNIINAAFRFSVPLFIMLSGYLLLDLSKEMNVKTFFKKRFLRIGIPFVFWIGFYFFWQGFMGIPITTGTIVSELVAVNLGHLYFLFIISELYFITPFLFNFLKNSSLRSRSLLFLISLGITFLISGVIEIFPRFSLVIRNALTIFAPYVSYYLAGYFIQKIKIIKRNSFYCFLIYLTIVFFTAFASNGEINSYLRSYGSPNIILMTFMAFVFLLNINRGIRLLKNNLVLKILKNLSSTIFGIYLIHIIIIDIFGRYFNFSPEKVSSVNLLIIGIEIFGVFVVSYLIVLFGRKIPYVKYVFG